MQVPVLTLENRIVLSKVAVLKMTPLDTEVPIELEPTGYVDVPVTVIICGLPLALSATATEAVNVPTIVGKKMMLTEQAEPVVANVVVQ